MGAVVRIGALPSDQRELAVRLLARAFRDNPLDRAVIGGSEERRLRSITHGMRASLRGAVGKATVLEASRDGTDCPLGILLALPPGGFPMAPLPLLVHLRSIFGQGPRVATRWGEVYRALEAVHPQEPHWYLSLLGVDPPHQRLGVGAALLAGWIESTHADGLPIYLETDREENVIFYAREGFEVLQELRVLGTPVWCMRRRPAARGPSAGGRADDLHAS